MEEKSLNWRIINTHDIEENWNKTEGFIPKAGEQIVYDPDSNYPYARVKIGNGITDVKELPFTVNSIIESLFNINDSVLYADAGKITSYNTTFKRRR